MIKWGGPEEGEKDGDGREKKKKWNHNIIVT